MTMTKGKKIAIALISLIAIAVTYFVVQPTHKETGVSAETLTAGPTQTFINEIAGTASQIAQERDLYASVMIAQAILESSSGQSGLSQAPYHNFFGIKGAYGGSSVMMKTWEDDGHGNPYEIDQPFRAYPSIADSLYDYANLLSTNTYAGVRKSNTLSYQDATAALTGLYATDTSYNVKLNNIIQTYGLTAYDVQNTAPQATAPSPVANTAAETNATSSNYVWNKHRRAYTDAATLAQDDAWSLWVKGY
ncbi:glycoside hydrolase family 73 protein [Streptococcus didelphis]|uniref:Glycoside hydrolase family 73 protein n=1 Tax=Streptococcus didelphis TaxID=102886 RepID=A0ABY9LHK0_9STRE|nr:glycoside hydrolase family 73 protein [Streptococcus didelphis]WMB28329.1 glycoside hydrolase family 73 protein [Streptococcus didelphis]WMB29008.1 glycoside hydrolase family 73 protein [Streptococcus didelphis]